MKCDQLSQAGHMGRTVKDVCREAGISEATYYNWKSRCDGMEASDIKKIKDLEDENRRLKQMVRFTAPATD